jgi:hypothetical protein
MVVPAAFVGCDCADAGEMTSPHPCRLHFLDDLFRTVWCPKATILHGLPTSSSITMKALVGISQAWVSSYGGTSYFRGLWSC